MRFNYSKNGLSVSYNGEISISVFRGIRDVPTVHNESGEMFVEITTNGKTEKRTDIFPRQPDKSGRGCTDEEFSDRYRNISTEPVSTSFHLHPSKSSNEATRASYALHKTPDRQAT